MENATKALIIVAGVFIGLMILALGINLYAGLSSYVKETNQTIEENALNRFNNQFLNYINCRDGSEIDFELKIQDIITIASIAYENNQEYKFFEENEYDESTYYVTISVDKVDGISNEQKLHLERNISSVSSTLLMQNMDIKYKCTPDDVKISPITGRVYEINFKKIID